MSPGSPRPPRRSGRSSLLLALTASLALLSSPLAAAESQGDAAPAGATRSLDAAAPAPRHSTVTLVTGDVVDADVAADGRVLSAALRSADGTDHASAVWQDGRHTYVFPQGVEQLVDAGTVDPELFDIDQLIADGYDDAHTAAVPLVVEYGGGIRPRAAAPGVRTTAALDSIGGAGLSVDKASAAGAWKSLAPVAVAPRARTAGGVSRIWLDRPVHGSSLGTPTVPLTGAGAAHALGLDGTGVKVAILDTGVDTGHPDLAGRVLDSRSFVNGETIEDLNGHGTHTASTLAGTGAASQGRYAGMAPGADLLVGKVLAADGSGSLSGIISGMQWAVASGARVVSMSLGSDGATSCTGPDVDAVEQLSDRALFVIAAGNASLRGTVSTPGCAPDALTVGAVDRSGHTASFSSRGPSADGVSAKPDIASQGVDVVAARAGGRGDQAYVSYSGTSMATPHVAGGAVLLLQQHPDLTPARLKALLTSSAAATDAPVLEQGAGQLDLARAITQRVVAAPDLTLGDFAYPQRQSAPADAPVTLTNLSPSDVTLSLAVAGVRGDDGSAVRGLVSLPRRTVTVPAGGSADVPVHLDPSVPLTAGAYGTVTGRLVGTSRDGQRVTVPFGVHMEEPSANLTVNGLDRHGDPAASPSTFQLFDAHRGTARRYTLGYPAAGSTTIRVPLGTYALSGTVMTRDEPGGVGSVASVAQLYRPKVVVNGDTAVTVDARDARAIGWGTDRPSQPRGFAMGISFGLDTTGQLKAGYLTTIPALTEAVYAQQAAGDDRLAFMASARLAAPAAALTSSGGRTLDAVPVQKGTEFDGQGSADLVYIGPGTDAAFAAHDLKGKLVLVDAGTGGGNPYLWSTSAAKAGAIGVLSAVPDTAGRFQFTGPEGVPQASVTWADSLALQAESARGPVTVRWSGTATAASPYLYDLARTTTGRTFTGVQKVHDKDLAVRDARYHVQGPDTTYWSDVQVGVPGMPSVWAGGTTLPLHAPQQRTEFFTPSPRLTWTTLMRRTLSPYDGTAYDGPHTVTAGRADADWYKTPYGATRTTYARALVRRDANRLTTVMPPVGDAGGHDSTLDRNDTGTRQLLLDGVPQVPVSGVYVVPQDQAVVTLRQQWSRPAGPADSLGLAYRTEWTFPTDAAAQGPQPLLVPVVDVPSDLRNQVPAGRAATVRLAAVTDAAGGPVPLDGVRLQYAYGDGTTVDDVTGWRDAPVARSHGAWAATVADDAPAGTFVHLRVVLSGAHGTRVDQTTVRAYRLA
ncbi:S8 family serine peptidase [Streptomyces sp. NPDC020917]|uniref:S8 family serine peptidase n=1 Tax=Streptomyces sp. NPDC020917 TaxID=3365102 RepID=UPI0037985A48